MSKLGKFDPALDTYAEYYRSPSLILIVSEKKRKNFLKSLKKYAKIGTKSDKKESIKRGTIIGGLEMAL